MVHDADDLGGAVRVVPGHARELSRDHVPELFGDGGEHLLRRRPVGDQRGDPAQRYLLVGVAAQVHAGLRVGDRGADQLGEAGQPRLGVRQQPLPARRPDGHDAPQLAVDGDRRADRRPEAPLVTDVGARAGGAAVVVHPHRPPGLEDQRDQVLPAEARPGARWEGHGGAGAAPRAESHHALRIVPADSRQVGAQQPAGFGGDRGVHLLGRRAAGDQGRHPPQRGLLIRVAAQVDAGLGVGDRGADQLGEGGQPRLGVGGQRLLARVRDDDDAPQPALDADRHPDARPDAEQPDDLAALPRELGEVVHAHRPGGLEHLRGHVLAAQPRARVRTVLAGRVPAGDDRHCVVLVVPAHGRLIGAEQAAGFGGDGGEHLFRGSTAGDEHRHAAQRGLLFRDPVACPGVHQGLRPGGRPRRLRASRPPRLAHSRRLTRSAASRAATAQFAGVMRWGRSVLS